MPGKKQTILVVEDEPAIRELIALTLQDTGFKTLEAGNGVEAVELLRDEARQMAAIVSDLQMPVLNGVELAKHNYENHNLPFIVCTTHSDSRTAIRLLDYGVQDYVLKPINEKHFIGIVHAAIKRHLLAEFDEAPDSLDGNVSNISIPAKSTHLLLAVDWVRRKTAGHFPAKEHQKFIGYVNEFLLNAYEHGSLKISEREKSRLLEEGRWEQEVRDREITCNAGITIDFAELGNDITIRITDEGDGFDHRKYLNMSEEMIIERLGMPNGRGIHMSANYFNSIEYSEKGESVMVIKNMPEKGGV